MPYTASTVPSYVPKAKAHKWATIWNAAYEGALKEGKSKEKAEEYAFAVASAKAGPNSKKTITEDDLNDNFSFQGVLDKLIENPLEEFEDVDY